MSSCDIAPEQIPNFNSHFYYNQLREQEALQTCYNDKMEMHFGREYAEKEDLFIDFKSKKAEFQDMQKWNPHYKTLKNYEKGHDADYVQSMTEMLLAKTKRAQAKAF